MNDSIKKVLNLLKEKPYVLRMGAGNIAKWQDVSIEDVKAAKILYYNGFKNLVQNGPRILIVDIETAPMRAYVWSRWKQNIYLDQTISEWFMLCWSAKWLNNSKVYGERLHSSEVVAEDDHRIIEPLWRLLDQADIVIAHNGKKFDIPKMNSRFIINGFPPTSPYKQIDTKEVAARLFGFSSNKLDALAGYFNFEHKMDTDFDLWVKCMNGDEEALEYMLTYNKKDVTLLEEVYLKLRPYIKGHPNLAVYYDIEAAQCGHCGSENLIFSGYTFTNVSKFETFRCTKCGAISRKRSTSQSKKKRNTLLTTIS